jgi:hypothetical protein
MQRVAVVGRVKPEAEPRVRELLEKGPPFDPRKVGFERHSVYFTGEEIVFIFEGGKLDQLLHAVVEDPGSAGAFKAWESVLDGMPRVAREAYGWERGDEWPEGWGE